MQQQSTDDPLYNLAQAAYDEIVMVDTTEGDDQFRHWVLCFKYIEAMLAFVGDTESAIRVMDEHQRLNPSLSSSIYDDIRLIVIPEAAPRVVHIRQQLEQRCAARPARKLPTERRWKQRGA